MAHNKVMTLHNKVMTLVVVSITICCFFNLLCAEEARGVSHLERNSAIARLKRMEASIKAVQSGRTQTRLGGAVAPVIRLPKTHVVNIGIGTPPKNFQGQVDTGSDLIWLQCDLFNRSNWYYPPPFYPEHSSTYRRVPCSSSLCSALANSTCASDCQYSHIYSESWSTQEELSFETFTMADTTGAAHFFGGIAFGCSHVVQEDVLEEANGVLGLGRGQLSLISQIGESKFSYCLPFEYNGSPFQDTDSFSTPLLFGSAAEFNGIGVQSTMVINNTVLPKLNSYYYLSVEGISLGNVSLNISRGMFDIQANGSGGFIIDSGIHFTVLPHAAFTAVASVLDSVLGLPRANDSKHGLSVCYSSPYYDYVPDLNMTFHMLGADYVVEGKHNFVQYMESGPTKIGNLLCLAMLDMDEASVAGVPAVLGSFQQQDYHILYDNANQRLSFTPTRCSSLSMSPNPSYLQSKAPIPILGSHVLLPVLLLYFVAFSLTL
ncbi:hypothetical protein SUGI_1401510 [Cryptomeria japonica]|uniref:Peptidase A1 domain-containing protein n=2 Tax=Cryptomeria japonica TaxID=3369 RepID=A0AAD3NRL0_CRYJA|nr:hypothetical protein SUGI_1279180 [Cryptomeria japonica]GLJ56980.1 hypothetical protein SUGI_1279290 [Cryptomeria japonica]GLJ56990.1 hypothetical protein SUGI_1279400 [Cryptomeria japonica]GLJ57246.1 hypothetical protein SUGI_1307520 [Cryptomeria japonica]GLJ57256.1 hypothetical protein SUGI_1307630 [Cryptomeria japonica]